MIDFRASFMGQLNLNFLVDFAIIFWELLPIRLRRLSRFIFIIRITRPDSTSVDSINIIFIL
jgi:hypothetical protein